MVDKNFYGMLQVADTATSEEVRAAYERLNATLGVGKPEEKAHLEAVSEAFQTLSDPVKRAKYDMAREASPEPAREKNVRVIERFWTLPKLIALAIVVVIGAGFNEYDKENEARLDAEKAVAAAKAREVAARDRAVDQDAERHRLAVEAERRQAAEKTRLGKLTAQQREEAERRERDSRKYLPVLESHRKLGEFSMDVAKNPPGSRSTR
jgi:curved DNA-binding protein CbpA